MVKHHTTPARRDGPSAPGPRRGEADQVLRRAINGRCVFPWMHQVITAHGEHPPHLPL